MKIIKTIQWNADVKALFTMFARKNWGVSSNPSPCHFVEFIASYQIQPLKDLIAFTEKMMAHNNFGKIDVTDIATFTENSCLFSTSGHAAAALDIVLTYLGILNTGGKVPALWCFLDEEKKAAVHFVNHRGYYAELYCAKNEKFSVLHLLETDNKEKMIIPVVFTDGSLPDEVLANVTSDGGHYLHDYLPRELCDLLSKGGRKVSGYKPKGTPLPPVSHAVAPDNWDNL